MSIGINLFAPVDATDSIGIVARTFAETLKSAGIECEIYILPRNAFCEITNYAVLDDNLFLKLKWKINLFYFNARTVPLYFENLTLNKLSSFYNIGYWVHEIEDFPKKWCEYIYLFNEIWTPSSYCQNAISLNANIPVIKVPYVVKQNYVSNKIKEFSKIEIKKDSFNFLYIFDVLSDAERKNPLIAIRAFLKVFNNFDNVKFLLKTKNLDKDILLKDILYQILKNNSNIVILDGDKNEQEMAELYNLANVYISLHRAEGFGLTIADAMSRGIPVITTGYSGNMDFCNSSFTRLVNFKLIEIGADRPRYKKSDYWAEPDLEDSIMALKDIYSNYSEWIKKASIGREYMNKFYSMDNISIIIKKRVELIYNNFKFFDDMSNRDYDNKFGILNRCEF